MLPMAPVNYVPLPKVPRRDGPAALAHDRFHADCVSGTLTLRYEALDPVRIGTGVPYVLDRAGGQKELVWDLALRGGTDRPILPGSSLKGAVRSLCEALGGGCDDISTCGSVPCVTCALFGYVKGQETWAGRVGFDDALGDNTARIGTMKLPRAFPPKRSVGRRAYGPAPTGVGPRVGYLVAPRGTGFRGRMTLLNVRPTELGLVLLALGQDGTFVPRVGGGKFFGLGRVRVTVEGARLRGRWGVKVRTADEIRADVAGWLASMAPDPKREEVTKVLRAQMAPR